MASSILYAGFPESTPIGVPAISRGLSAAMPPVAIKRDRTPKGVPVEWRYRSRQSEIALRIQISAPSQHRHSPTRYYPAPVSTRLAPLRGAVLLFENRGSSLRSTPG